VDRNRRAAFLSTLRGVVGSEGQRVHAGDRLYLAEGLPVLIVWGARDPIIPVAHAESAHEAMPGSRLEIFEGAGHLPQVEAPERFVTVLKRFMADTEARPFDPDQWRGRLRPPDPER
jgi:pimeloyl-ACP methyl ester carboxylesterase